MKRILCMALSLLFIFSIATAAQNANSSTTNNNSNAASKPKTPRKPIFRASKDQIQQAQKILKDRGFYVTSIEHVQQSQGQEGGLAPALLSDAV